MKSSQSPTNLRNLKLTRTAKHRDVSNKVKIETKKGSEK